MYNSGRTAIVIQRQGRDRFAVPMLTRQPFEKCPWATPMLQGYDVFTLGSESEEYIVWRVWVQNEIVNEPLHAVVVCLVLRT